MEELKNALIMFLSYNNIQKHLRKRIQKYTKTQSYITYQNTVYFIFGYEANKIYKLDMTQSWIEAIDTQAQLPIINTAGTIYWQRSCMTSIDATIMIYVSDSFANPFSYKYFISNNTFLESPKNRIGRQECTTEYSAPAKSIFLIGGGVAAIEKFSEIQQTWKTLAQSLTNPMRNSRSIVYSNGLIYVIGGQDGNFNALNTVHAIDPFSVCFYLSQLCMLFLTV